MSKYNVHIYPVVRVKIENIEAESQVEAIKKADKEFEFSYEEHLRDSESAEENTGYLVDEIGDDEYANSCCYESDGETKSADVADIKAKLARYEWLCKAFHNAYFEDAIDDKTFVNANALHFGSQYRTVQFTINIQERRDSPVDLDAAIAEFMVQS